jgi:hypothetical protein
MRPWFDRMRFLWEEESPPPQEIPRAKGEEIAGVPRPMRRATRFALVSLLATSLMGQIIGVRLIAPVDAAPVHPTQCEKNCNQAFQACTKACPNGSAGNTCRDNCRTTQSNCIAGCHS